MSLEFLKQITVEDPGVARKSSGGGARKQWNPASDILAIRVWKTGAIYPSAELTEQFSLEFGNKPSEGADAADTMVGHGFDIFKSSDFPIFKTPQEVILLNVVAKNKGKVDVFGTTNYNEDGTPKVSVMEQGASTFGKDTLLPALKAVYDVEPNEQGFIDLVLVGQNGETSPKPFSLPNGKTICHVPKEIARGTKAGEMTYVRREHPELYVLYPYLMLHADEAAGEKAMDNLEKRHAAALVD